MKDTQVIQIQFFGSGSSVPVEQHPEPMCARGSIPLPTTKKFLLKDLFVCRNLLIFVMKQDSGMVLIWWFPILTLPLFFSAL
jgi:hypothetical protein